MIKLLHLTDLHFSLKDASAQTKFLALVDQLQRLHSDADLCVITGDIVDDRDRATHRIVFDALGALPFPVLLVAGNHDDREMLAECGHANIICKRYRHFIQYRYHLNELEIVIVDTNSAGAGENDGKGYFDDERLEWLNDALSAAKDDTLLLMHHAPAFSAIKFMEKFRMQDLDKFQECLIAHRHLRHILFGHVHQCMYGSLGHISFSTPGSASVNIRFDASESFIAIASTINYGILFIDQNVPSGWNLVAQTINYEA